MWIQMASLSNDILERGFPALWSPAGKGRTYWLLFVIFNCVFGTFPCGILGQVWYLIVSIPDLCRLSYFDKNDFEKKTADDKRRE